MIIQTSKCDFLIEENSVKSGYISVYSENLEEMQRFFGSSETEFSAKGEWKYCVSICKQDLANALILMVKEVNYQTFTPEKFQQA